MKAYISIDMEGLPGIVSGTMLNPWSSQFSRASRVMTKVVNVVVDELYKHGFREVVVADSHGLMTNIEYLDLDSRVQLIQGYPRPLSMVTGLTRDYTAVFFIGYHAAAGTPHGILEHTYSGRAFSEIRINGIKASEYLINSLIAGEIGVPVALLTGDEVLRREVELYTPWVVFRALKKGISRYAAIYPGLEVIERDLREGIREAVNKIKNNEVKLFELSKPYTVELVFRESLIPDVLEAWDIMERVNAYTLRYKTESAIKLFNTIEIAAMVTYAIECLRNNLR